MARPIVVDSFMINNELDMLECRLTEIGDAVDYVIAVEANVDHQDHPKPYHLTENLSRFDAWKDKLIVVRATGLPTIAENPDAWAREHAQREHVATGLVEVGAQSDWVIMHGDLDEIPKAVVVRNLRPPGYVALAQRGHFWSLRWQYPIAWHGTVAARLGHVDSFGAMRDRRNFAPKLPDAGWHLSWLPTDNRSTEESATAKVRSFCHGEVEDRILNGLKSGHFIQQGYHVDGVRMTRCEIDHTYPKWIRDGKHPESWAQ